MTGSNIHSLEIVFLLLLLFVIVFGYLARKLNTPYPIILVIGGLLLSFVPGIPRVTLNPDVVFFVVFPPLLFSAAWLTSWREFRYNLVSILFLAFGLVTFTVFGVAASWRWLPGFDWRSAFLLGAVVATTDPAAVIAIFRDVGAPGRLTRLVEGEALLNDAAAIALFAVLLGMIVAGREGNIGSGLSEFFLSFCRWWIVGAGCRPGTALGDAMARRRPPCRRHADPGARLWCVYRR